MRIIQCAERSGLSDQASSESKQRTEANMHLFFCCPHFFNVENGYRFQQNISNDHPYLFSTVYVYFNLSHPSSRVFESVEWNNTADGTINKSMPAVPVLTGVQIPTFSSSTSFKIVVGEFLPLWL